jgi:cation diffusion facilitator family transporter
MDEERDGCCAASPKFDGVSPDYTRRLWLVIAINAAMFLAEMAAGTVAGSQALRADALDFLADATTYGISLAVIGASTRARSTAAVLKGTSLSLMAVWVLGTTAYHVFVAEAPKPEVMGAIGVLALLANLTSVLFLIRYKDGDANVRSVWLCSRNDAIGNVAVMIAALGVWGTATAWPDLIVAAIMATLFLTSSAQILRQAWYEYRVEAGVADASPDAHAFAQAPCGMDDFRGDPGTDHIRNRNRCIDRWDKDID